MMKTGKTFKIIGNACRIVLAAASVLLAAILLCMAFGKASGNSLPMPFGWGYAIVTSGSMEPELPVGALIVIRKQDGYAVGDVVTFKEENGALVTHRLQFVDGNTAITKGDANNTEDAPIETEQILGKVTAVLPNAGNILLWLKGPAGILLLLLFGGLAVILPECLRKVVRKHEET